MDITAYVIISALIVIVSGVTGTFFSAFKTRKKDRFIKKLSVSKATFLFTLALISVFVIPTVLVIMEILPLAFYWISLSLSVILSAIYVYYFYLLAKI